MYIYNVTVNVDDSAINQWTTWMRETHIPDVLQTGLFLGATMSRLMVEEESGTTFSIQYKLKDEESFRLYQEMYAPALQADHKKRFEEKTVAFRTMMEVLAEFTAERLD
ncbi:MAG: DUF4286 family protein [Bacteroidetes bacterium]|uniref:DUF4286 family protein n=1 Tax=Phaeocystidibacter marisrubri TaxID=1577780 RepID=A0A6L3ZES8_9FLAO|nr:DUF4286 family protein [Phaeocystidibacter marisrubri]KAB2815902.1 DUF4286 family protein [Phaeocystidibacter marisrubri]TNE30746.1 MAG: DUF4286 family protein [Bacteroidota bacterium]